MDSSLVNFLDDLCDQTCLEDSILEHVNDDENVEPPRGAFKTCKSNPSVVPRIVPKAKPSTKLQTQCETNSNTKPCRILKPTGRTSKPKATVIKPQKYINPSFIPKNNKWSGSPAMEPSLQFPLLELDEVAAVRERQKLALDLARLNKPFMEKISKNVCSDLAMMFIRIALDKYVGMSEEYRYRVIIDERGFEGNSTVDEDQPSRRKPTWECVGFDVEFE